ncbi:MAG: hypothetical protein ACYSR7_06245, partial [Planctomycetota bacterium]
MRGFVIAVMLVVAFMAGGTQLVAEDEVKGMITKGKETLKAVAEEVAKSETEVASEEVDPRHVRPKGSAIEKAIQEAEK